jgi:hypothetical protein
VIKGRRPIHALLLLAAVGSCCFGAVTAASAQGPLTEADQRRCAESAKELVRVAESEGLGTAGGVNDNLLIIAGERFRVQELRRKRPDLFASACRSFLAAEADTQDELRDIARALQRSDRDGRSTRETLDRIAAELERSRGGFLRDWGPFIGVLLGGLLAFWGGAVLQRQEQRTARLTGLKERTVDAVSAAEGWVLAKKEESPDVKHSVARKKSEATAAGGSLISALALAERDPWLIGTKADNSERIKALRECAESIFGEGGSVSDGLHVQAAGDLEKLRNLAKEFPKRRRFPRPWDA